MSKVKAKVKLGEITTKIGSGATPTGGGNSYKLHGISFIRSQNVLDFKFTYDGLAFIDDLQADSLKNVEVKPEDILLNITGDSVARVCKVPNEVLPARVNQHVSIIRADKNKILPNYILYYLQSIKDYLLIYSEIGGTRNALTKSMIENIDIELPSLSEQKGITEILKSLDDKIDLLHRQNKTLEQLAETLFRQWFVEEADESWESLRLGDIAVVQNGYAFSSRDYVSFHEGYLEVLKMGHIEKGGGLRTNPKRDYVPNEDKLKRWVLNKSDIVMAMTDMKDNVVILGVPALIDESDRYVLNQRVARIYLSSNEKLLNNYLLYIQLKNSEFIATLQSKANSGVQVNLSTDSIKDSEILIPPLNVQKEKGNILTELYLKKEINDSQILTLTNLRDTLLPKLMNGEIEIESIKTK